MIQIQNIIQVVCRAYKQGEITELEATRELYKHGFAHYANDTNALHFYLTHSKY